MIISNITPNVALQNTRGVILHRMGANDSLLGAGRVWNDESADQPPDVLVDDPAWGGRGAGDHHRRAKEHRPALLARHKVVLHRELKGEEEESNRKGRSLTGTEGGGV